MQHRLTKLCNPSPGSPRMTFQWYYVFEYLATHPRPNPDEEPKILNIGCADDPLWFGELARHVDMDDWSAYHKFFTQADASHLPFEDKSYDLVILADILEHCENPTMVADEACRVVSVGGKLIITVFEEWKLPGTGQWIQESHVIADELNRTMGYKDREDFQVVNFPDRKGFDDDKVSHLAHINQFGDADMEQLFQNCVKRGLTPIIFNKAYEATHEGHPWHNWLMCFQRRSA